MTLHRPHEGLVAATEKMRRKGVAEAAIRTFAHAYRELAAGASGTLPDHELEPVRDVPDATDLTTPADRATLDRAVIIKLNGGLGTSMGMSGPKTLIEAREGLSFLDVIARQVLGLREQSGARLPLVLMNSFRTRDATLAALARYPELDIGLPPDFLQHREPRIRSDDLQPVQWPQRPELEWCPPGHGDLYPALASSGMLAMLLDHGYEYAFVSNADNLGAILDPGLLGWFAAQDLPFAMEVVIGTEADRKGGHIARRSDGRLVLRETAQTPPEDADSFRDFRRWRYYNTHNLWINLRALAELLRDGDGVLALPLIVNRKRVDPGDRGSPEVIQLETAMGAAIGAFEGARAVCVRRARFAPVKTTDDLLVLRSVVYRLSARGAVERTPGRDGELPFVELDPEYFRHVDDFDRRLPHGPPSLIGAERLVVRGDVTFGAGVVARGRAEIGDGDRPLHIPDGAVLDGEANRR
ncbi:MAG: UTP--glucose-phosphate uridylyltransferase [Solirubrobacteraceae bacterium]|nr:UTP--glucose-phosphate uridylyltransferase [Solirubrobacteraceae bacterium]